MESTQSPMSDQWIPSDELTMALKHHAVDLGFEAVGIVAAQEATTYAPFLRWLEKGHAGEMKYLNRRREAYQHPDGVLPGCKSLVMLLVSYKQPDRSTDRSGHGKVAAYACSGIDYHDQIRQQLRQLSDWLKRMEPSARCRGAVDTAPLLERDFARLAGLGWIGKNTMLIHPKLGSYTFIAALLTDLELKPDAPFATQHCGTCRACLDACPTQAFPAPYQLDATRCISYWTIESRSVAPESLRPALGDWVWGCDICQEVCPWNRKPIPSQTDWLQGVPTVRYSDLADLLSIDETTFTRRFANSPMLRAGWSGVVRNAALAAGNQKLLSAKTLLTEHLKYSHPDCTQEAIRWALGRIDDSHSQEA
ncbi:MAG: tRNA epoxyqueuosine(34) reductase QueG [Pirellulaceae bacterium]